MHKRTLKEQAERKLKGLRKYGESRHEAKKASGGGFGASSPWIHSYATYETYTKALDRFCDWAVEHGAGCKANLTKTIERLGPAYLEERMASCSVWTVKMERAALSKVLGHALDVKLPERTPEGVVRSRGEAKRDAHFSESRNHDLCLLARSTGARRADLANMKKEDFFERDGRLYVHIDGSKGGRDRIAPVLPEKQDEVRELLKSRPEGRLFEKIHSGADIHSMRRDYAQALYEAVKADRGFRDECLRKYPERVENVESELYKARSGFSGLRDDIYVVTQALGHNRLDVTVSHYLS